MGHCVLALALAACGAEPGDPADAQDAGEAGAQEAAPAMPVEPEPEPAEPAVGPWDLPDPPPKSAYDGPLFALSHDYPSGVTPPDPAPWREAIGMEQIDVGNAAAYTQALRDYVAEDMETLLYDYAGWDPAAAGWYSQPWLSTIREPIRGTYVGSPFPPAMFPKSGLKADMVTHVVVYYDAVAAGSLASVWGMSGMDPLPGLQAGGAQFAEGSIIVKPAFTTATPDTWAPLEGALAVPIWASSEPDAQDPPPAELLTVRLFQLDVIVKDTASAPRTQWVYATLVYDAAADGEGFDKMVPLGAMWGNDPGVDSPEGCDYLTPGDCPALAETWLNADAPLYARETLGWGGRLSGPNDGAVDVSAVIEEADGSLKKYPGRYAMSSCMSCHSAAEYEMASFLLPAPAKCVDDQCTPRFAVCDEAGACKEAPPGPGAQLIYFDAGSSDFAKWFQDRGGADPMDAGAIALDYDMVYSFKALPHWYQNTQQTPARPRLNFVEEFNNYRGLRYDD